MEVCFHLKVDVPDGEYCSLEGDNLGEGCDCLIIDEGKYGGPNNTTFHCRYVRNVHPESDDEVNDDGGLDIMKHELCPNSHKP